MFSRLGSWMSETGRTSDSPTISPDGSPRDASHEQSTAGSSFGFTKRQRNTVLLDPQHTEALHKLHSGTHDVKFAREGATENPGSLTTNSGLVEYLFSGLGDRQPGMDSLTRKVPRTVKKRIEFQVIWETIDLVGRYRAYNNSCLCLSFPDLHSDLSRMIAKDELVTGPVDVAYINITFPLRRPTQRIVRPGQPALGFRRDELCIQIANIYRDVYDTERISSADPDSVLWDNGIGPNDDSGKFGIHGHRLTDLFLTAVLWDPGRSEFTLSVEV